MSQIYFNSEATGNVWGESRVTQRGIHRDGEAALDGDRSPGRCEDAGLSHGRSCQRQELESYFSLGIAPSRSLRAETRAGLVKGVPSPWLWEGRALHRDGTESLGPQARKRGYLHPCPPKSHFLHGIQQRPEPDGENTELYYATCVNEP